MVVALVYADPSSFGLETTCCVSATEANKDALTKEGKGLGDLRSWLRHVRRVSRAVKPRRESWRSIYVVRKLTMIKRVCAMLLVSAFGMGQVFLVAWLFSTAKQACEEGFNAKQGISLDSAAQT